MGLFMTSSKAEKKTVPYSNMPDPRVKRFVVKPEGLSHRPFHENAALLKLRRDMGTQDTEVEETL